MVNQVQNAYNGFWQLTNQYQQHSGPVSTSTSPQVGYTYADGSANTVRLTAITYPGTFTGSTPRAISYDYASGNDDALSRVTSFVDSDGTTLVAYTYLGLGTFVQSTSAQPQITWSLKGGSGANPYTGLDLFGRRVNCQWNNAASVIEQLQYGYDQDSNRLWRNQTVATGNDELYVYDGLKRLVDMSRGGLTNGNQSISNVSLAQQWNLDATGNWSGFVNTDVNAPANTLGQQRGSNPANEILGITQHYGTAWAQPAYDAAGNMTTIPQPGSPANAFSGTYDAWNRLVTLAGTATYSYDGYNRRITKSVSGTVRHFYYSDQWQVLEERLGAATTPDRQFVWGLRYVDDLVLRDGAADRLYALQDANWNVTAIVTSPGAVQERFHYDAHGICAALNPDFSMTTSHTAYDWENRYAGYLWDAESALYCVRNRYLHPALGFWVSRDPIGLTTEDWNLYRYSVNTPVNATDPTGQFPVVAPRLAPPPTTVCTPLGAAVGIGVGVGCVLYVCVTKPLLEPCFTRIAYKVWCPDNSNAKKAECKCVWIKTDYKGQPYYDTEPSGKGAIPLSDCKAYCKSVAGTRTLYKVSWDGKWIDP